MGFKHLLAYCLVIAGIALVSLLFIFSLNKEAFNGSFLTILACLAGVSCLIGGVMLKRLS